MVLFQFLKKYILSITESKVRPTEEIVRQVLQTRLEEAYPNVLSMDDLVRYV